MIKKGAIILAPSTEQCNSGNGVIYRHFVPIKKEIDDLFIGVLRK
jgi:hypothetical protein